MLLLFVVPVQLLILQHSDANLILGCGLFAFIGTNPRKCFSWEKFNVLGLFNDNRGGDACGRIVGNKIQHGLDDLKKYEKFASEKKPPVIHVRHNIVIGHCRRASVGGKLDDYAQPIVLYKDELDMSLITDKTMLKALSEMKDNDVVFSGIHNGTIENYLELAEEYKINSIGKNDSQILLTILFYKNYDVLQKYIGTAALIWHNYALNESFVFKGASLSWESATTISEERPLYTWTIDNENYYLSSIADSLRFIQNGKNEPVYIVKENTLYKFKDGANVSSKKYDRSNCMQYKQKKYTNTLPINTGLWDGYRRNNYKGEQVPWERKTADPTDGKEFVRDFAFGNTKSFRISSEKTQYQDSLNLKRIIYNKTRYWMNGGLLHGIYALSQGGVIPFHSNIQNMIALKLYYFVEGIMMDGLQAYKVAMKLHKEFMKTIYVNSYSISYEEDDFTFSIAKYSRYPIIPILNSIGIESCYQSKNNGLDPKKNLFSGDYQPLFSYRKYLFYGGELKKISAFSEMKKGSHDIDDTKSVDEYLKEFTFTNLIDKENPSAIGYKLLKQKDSINPFSPLQQYILDNVELSNIYDETTIFTINYMRDFDQFIRDKCRKCPYEYSIATRSCAMCEHIRRTLDYFETKKQYGIT